MDYKLFIIDEAETVSEEDWNKLEDSFNSLQDYLTKTYSKIPECYIKEKCKV